MTELQLFQQWLEFCGFLTAQQDVNEIIKDKHMYVCDECADGYRYVLSMDGRLLVAHFDEGGYFQGFQPYTERWWV